MAAPQRVTGTDVCDLSERWLVRLDVLERLQRGAQRFEAETGREVFIISGHRTVAQQLELKRQGRPAADPSVSNHTTCPATAVDLRIGLNPTRVLKAILGRSMVEQGLRWGGGSRPDSGGIPTDWNHFDLGPRR